MVLLGYGSLTLMSITSGIRLGVYEVTAKLGEGGTLGHWPGHTHLTHKHGQSGHPLPLLR